MFLAMRPPGTLPKAYRSCGRRSRRRAWARATRHERPAAQKLGPPHQTSTSRPRTSPPPIAGPSFGVQHILRASPLCVSSLCMSFRSTPCLLCGASLVSLLRLEHLAASGSTAAAPCSMPMPTAAARRSVPGGLLPAPASVFRVGRPCPQGACRVRRARVWRTRRGWKEPRMID